jgi:NADPH:quinone reductase-like Zn-dependent oxidoreductase
VGGATLAGLLGQIHYGGAVAASGLTAGVKLETTVMPFILRSVALLGVDSVQAGMEERVELWRRLADDLRPPQLDDSITREIGLDELEGALDAILQGGLTGRTVVRVAG